MKIKSYRFLFRIFSFLSDKTNGASLFVKYKLVLGALLVGLTTVSCGDDEDEPEMTCYLTVSPEVVPDSESKSAQDESNTLDITDESFEETEK